MATAIEQLAQSRARPPLLRAPHGKWGDVLRACLKEHGYVNAVESGHTMDALEAFQLSRGLAADGIAGPVTWAWLGCSDPEDLGHVALVYARIEYYNHAREIGGNNRGPFVRKYLGWDGKGAEWCVGYGTYNQRQAAARLGKPAPFEQKSSTSALCVEADGHDRLRGWKDGSFRRATVQAPGGNRLRRPISFTLMGSALPEPQPGSLVCIKGGKTGAKHTALLVAIDTAAQRCIVLEGNVRGGDAIAPQFRIPGTRDAVRFGSYRLDQVVFCTVG